MWLPPRKQIDKKPGAVPCRNNIGFHDDDKKNGGDDKHHNASKDVVRSRHTCGMVLGQNIIHGIRWININTYRGNIRTLLILEEDIGECICTIVIRIREIHQTIHKLVAGWCTIQRCHGGCNILSMSRIGVFFQVHSIPYAGKTKQRHNNKLNDGVSTPDLNGPSGNFLDRRWGVLSAWLFFGHLLKIKKKLFF